MMSAVGLLCRIMFMRQATGGSVLFLPVEVTSVGVIGHLQHQ
jgi:hypothetical protein